MEEQKFERLENFEEELKEKVENSFEVDTLVCGVQFK